jgi:hypothetical protein
MFLATARAQAPASGFFQARLAAPAVFRDAALVLSEVVRARYHRFDAWRSILDPIVSAGAETVRMEVFSTCGSVYARLDLESASFEDARFGEPGATNVDFGDRLVDALDALDTSSSAALDVSEEGLALDTGAARAIERKVRLPERWLRGLSQIQAIERRAKLAAELDGWRVKALAETLPGTKTGRSYVALDHLRVLPARPAGPHLVIDDARRLRPIARALRHAKAVRVFGAEGTDLTVWSADFGAARLEIALASRVWHAFSGDGDALLSQSVAGAAHAHASIIALGREVGAFDPATLATRLDLDRAAATRAIDELGTSFGYDLASGRLFYRPIPFVANSHTRLAAARELDHDAMEIETARSDEDGTRIAGWVRGGASYRVELAIDRDGRLVDGKCTCAWISRHGLERGPCKHMLALRSRAEEQSD